MKMILAIILLSCTLYARTPAPQILCMVPHKSESLEVSGIFFGNDITLQNENKVLKISVDVRKYKKRGNSTLVHLNGTAENKTKAESQIVLFNTIFLLEPGEMFKASTMKSATDQQGLEVTCYTLEL